MTDDADARSPVLSGEITREGALGIVQEVERLRTTGVLRFESGDLRGEIDLIAGQIALDQREMAGGEDPVEAFLELREGKYEVYQRLPPLPVSKGDDLTRAGSLAVHVPADLMNYCEHAGMTGTLVLENGGRRAEIVYHAGNLVAIRVEGEDEQDLHEVFGWEEGAFHIRAQSQAPPVSTESVEIEIEPAAEAPKPPKPREETGQHFLRSVEVALAEIVEEREKRRSPTRTGPQLPPQPRARPATLPGVEPPPEPPTKPAKRRREPTVQVIYLSAREADGIGIRHIGADVASEHGLPEASPERRRAEETASGEPKPASGEHAGGVRAEGAGAGPQARSTTKKDAPAQPPPGGTPGTLAWVLVVLTLIVVALGILASLPPMQ